MWVWDEGQSLVLSAGPAGGSKPHSGCTVCLSACFAKAAFLTRCRRTPHAAALPYRWSTTLCSVRPGGPPALEPWSSTHGR